MTTSSDFTNSLPSENIPLVARPMLENSERADSFFQTEPGAINGTTDTMSLPESLPSIEVESSPAIFSTPDSSIALGGFSVLGLVACGAICIQRIYRPRKKAVSPVGDRPRFPNQFLFFADRSLATIPKATRLLHDRSLANVIDLARRARAIDDKRFRARQFIDFAKLKYGIIHRLEQYRDFARSIQRLEIALKAREHYRAIEEIETEYRGPVQQEFYRFVTYLLAECPDKESFQLLLQEKLEESFSLLVSESGRVKLFEYFQAIEKIVEEEGGLTLLGLFKYIRSAHVSILNMVALLLDRIDIDEERIDKKIAGLVRENYDTLAQLQPILGLSASALHPDSLARILQYIILDRHYHLAFHKFEESIALLQEWYLSYQVVMGIRQEHPPTEYRQPKNFSEPIPGIDLYQQYEKSLTEHSMV